MQDQAETLMNGQFPQEPTPDGKTTDSPLVMPKRGPVFFGGVLVPLACICLWTMLALMRGGLSGDWSRDIGYLLMALSVPVVNWQLLQSCKHDKVGLSPALTFCGGLTLVVSLLFSCLFLPLALVVLGWLGTLSANLIESLVRGCDYEGSLVWGVSLYVAVVVVSVIAIVRYSRTDKNIGDGDSRLIANSVMLTCGLCIWAFGATVFCALTGGGLWGFLGAVVEPPVAAVSCSGIALIIVTAVCGPFMAFGAGCDLMIEGLRSPAAKPSQLRALCLSVFLGFPIVFLYDSDRTVCKQIMLSLWRDNSRDERAMVRLMREFSLERDLLSLCYSQTGPTLDIDTLLFRLPQTQIPAKFARQMYYRVTGQPFNTAPLPPMGITTGVAKMDDPDWAADEVGGMSNGLRLSKSTMKGDISTDSGVAQFDWNITFKNDASVDKEARAQILLPPGAVVSGAKLWMNGAAKEATFCETNIARDIYSNVVRVQRRDPLLITTSGPNRIEVQCFPIPPHSKMRAALSVTAPVQFLTSSKGAIVMPRIIEKNFDIANDASTHLELHITNDARNRDLDESISDSELAKLVVSLDTTLPAGQLKDIATENGLVAQNVKQLFSHPLSDLEIVIDASASVSQHLPELRQLLQSLPAGRTAHVYLASDEIGGTAGQSLNREEISQALADLGKIRFAGGPDNVPALAAACRYARQHHGGVVWLHGPQPVVFDSSQQELSSLLFSDYSDVSILDLPLVDGANRTLSAFESSFTKTKPAIISQSSLGVGRSLSTCLQEFCGIASLAVIERTKMEGTVPTPSPEFASASLEKLMIHSQIRDLLSHGDASNAAVLGEKARLVTPVTAALVVEPDFHYQRDEWNHEPDQEIGPGLDGVLKWSTEREIRAAYHAVVSQLNNLSSAAASGGVPNQPKFENTVAQLDHLSSSAAAGGGDVNIGSFTTAPHSVPDTISQEVAELSLAHAKALSKHSGSPMTEHKLRVVEAVLSTLLSTVAGLVFLLVAAKKRWLRNHIIRTGSFAIGIVVITLVGLHFALPTVRDLMICLLS